MFVRRLDDQVKVNGYRIELAEVEIGLSGYALVEQVVVIVRNNQLAAYVKPKAGTTFGAAEIAAMKAEASQTLTTYMIPR